MAADSANNNEPMREVRLGVVLYGGISLAIYIYGVVRELYELTAGASPAYRALKDLLDADVVVDVVSGASAGGINGVLLGRALATQGDLSVCDDMWVTHGDILSLLQPSEGPFEAEGAYPKALFRSSDVLEAAIASALKEIQKAKVSKEKHPDWSPSWPTELDAFVAGTDIFGRVQEHRDSRGSSYRTKDHALRFQLKHRADRGVSGQPPTVRRSDFTAGETEGDEVIRKQLAKLCRLTSAFPVAFHPVALEAEADPLLSKVLRGTKLKPDDKRWVSDGGILDNKPFGPVNRTIFYRTTRRPVDRKLIFVEPDPVDFDTSGADEEMPEPASVALRAIASIPSYESIRADLQEVRAHNARVRRLSRLIEIAESKHDGSQTSPPEEPLFEAACVRSLVEQVALELEEHGLSRNDAQLATVEETLTSIFSEGSSAGISRDSVDVRFHLRRHFYVLEKVYKRVCQTRAPDQSADTLSEEIALGELYSQIRLLRIIEGALFRQLGKRIASKPAILDRKDELLGLLESLHRDILTNRGWTIFESKNWNENGQLLNYEIDEFFTQVNSLADSPNQGQIGELSLDIINERSRKIVDAIYGSSEENPFKKFDALKVSLVPVQVISGLFELDEIEVVRVSPFDTNDQRHPKPWKRKADARKKIRGDSLYHFGGMLQASWRANDIAWGRLDASEILIDALLSDLEKEHSLNSSKDAPDQKRRVVSAEKKERVVNALQAHLTQEEAEALRGLGSTDDLSWLSELRRALVKVQRRHICQKCLPDLVDLREKEAAEVEDRRPRRAPRDAVEAALVEPSGIDTQAERVLGDDSDDSLMSVDPRRLTRIASKTGLLLTGNAKGNAARRGAIGGMVADFARPVRFALRLAGGLALAVQQRVGLLTVFVIGLASAATAGSIVLIIFGAFEQQFSAKASVLTLVLLALFMAAWQLLLIILAARQSRRGESPVLAQRPRVSGTWGSLGCLTAAVLIYSLMQALDLPLAVDTLHENSEAAQAQSTVKSWRSTASFCYVGLYLALDAVLAWTLGIGAALFSWYVARQLRSLVAIFGSTWLNIAGGFALVGGVSSVVAAWLHTYADYLLERMLSPDPDFGTLVKDLASFNCWRTAAMYFALALLVSGVFAVGLGVSKYTLARRA